MKLGTVSGLACIVLGHVLFACGLRNSCWSSSDIVNLCSFRYARQRFMESIAVGLTVTTKEQRFRDLTSLPSGLGANVSG